jgi:glycerol kinase
VSGFLLALDQGTSSSRAVVFDPQGQPLASGQQELEAHFPAPGWVEQDPEAIWHTQLAAAQRALATAGVAAAGIAAVGIATQRETVVIWERASGKPLHRALVWQDRRTAAQCAAWRRQGLEPLVAARTGLLLDPYFSATKLAWLLDRVPGLRRRAEAGEVAFGTVDSWLLYRLTQGAVHATDVTNAARTLLFNIATMSWDDELLRCFGIPRAMLPEVRPTAGTFGTTVPELFGRALPITAVAGDQQAALFGQACLEPGMAKNTYGTGSFLLLFTGAEAVRRPGVLTTPAWRLGDAPAQFALEAPILTAGAAVQWLRDALGLIGRPAEVEALARRVPDSGGVVFVPALAGLGAPAWDPQARGVLLGLSRGSSAAHLARATLEAMACATRDGLEAMAADGAVPVRELRVDGGAAANDLLLQLQADVLGLPVLRAVRTEATAFGAAALAAVGAGLWGLGDVARAWRCDRRFLPQLAAAARERHYRTWRRAVALCQQWARDDEG